MERTNYLGRTKYIEEVKEITILSGSTTGVVDEKTDSDNTVIVGAIIYHDPTIPNVSIVNASLEYGGDIISKNQDIRNYRSREASYASGYKPVENSDSGKRIRWEIRSSSAFTSDFKAQLILIKEVQNC